MEREHEYLVNIKNLADTAKRDNWVVEYDADVDSFYWTRPEISQSAQLTKLSDDFALYLTPEGQVEGLFIEYAKYNFVEHNKDFKPLFDKLELIDENRYTLPKEEERNLKDLLSSMAHKIAAETLFKVAEKNIRIEQAFA